jgi:hypothetical protein
MKTALQIINSTPFLLEQSAETLRTILQTLELEANPSPDLLKMLRNLISHTADNLENHSKLLNGE